MFCPRCGNDRETVRGPCPYCGSTTPPLIQTEPARGSSLLSQGGPASLFGARAVKESPIGNLSLSSSPPARFDLPESVEHRRDGATILTHLQAPFDQSLPDQRVPSHTEWPITTDMTGGEVPPGVLRTSLDGASSSSDDTSISPGTLLNRGRYRLAEKQESQQWSADAYETRWFAQDTQRGGAYVLVYEVMLPEKKAVARQANLRTAMRAFTSLGGQLSIPALGDVFREHGRDFFVFAFIDGESLLARMQRLRNVLQEQEVIEGCLYVTEVLELISQQSPPLVHGLIRPEHILTRKTDGQWILTNFSLVLASGTRQFFASADRSFSPYAPPEFAEGQIDVRSDLYALMATAFYAVTGKIPAQAGGRIPRVRQLNPSISSQFDVILARGLLSSVDQRYQRPSELRQDLLALRAVSGKLVPENEQRRESVMIQRSVRSELPFSPSAPALPGPIAAASPLSGKLVTENEQRRESVTIQRSVRSELPFSPGAPALPNPIVAAPLPYSTFYVQDEKKTLLPRPEDLPAFQHSNTNLATVYWITGILIVLCLLVLLR